MDQQAMTIEKPARRFMRCRVCGTPAASFAIRSTRFYQCPSCGLYMRAPSFWPDATAARARYRLHQNSPRNSGYLAWLEQFIEKAIIPYACPGATILDYGSGPEPVLATLIASRGYDVALYDIHFTRTRKWKARMWDVIILHEVLEHLPYPKETLQFLAHRLVPNGFLAIRTQLAPSHPSAFASWWYKEDPTHLCMYTPGSVTRLSTVLDLDSPLHMPPDIYIVHLKSRQ